MQSTEPAEYDVSGLIVRGPPEVRVAREEIFRLGPIIVERERRRQVSPREDEAAVGLFSLDLDPGVLLEKGIVYAHPDGRVAVEFGTVDGAAVAPIVSPDGQTLVAVGGVDAVEDRLHEEGFLDVVVDDVRAVSAYGAGTVLICGGVAWVPSRRVAAAVEHRGEFEPGVSFHDWLDRGLLGALAGAELIVEVGVDAGEFSYVTFAAISETDGGYALIVDEKRGYATVVFGRDLGEVLEAVAARGPLGERVAEALCLSLERLKR